MSCFSREYFRMNLLEFDGDFSYLDEYKSLNEGEAFLEICEGLGTYGIIKTQNKPYIIVNSSGETVEYEFFITNDNK